MCPSNCDTQNSDDIIISEGKVLVKADSAGTEATFKATVDTIPYQATNYKEKDISGFQHSDEAPECMQTRKSMRGRKIYVNRKPPSRMIVGSTANKSTCSFFILKTMKNIGNQVVLSKNALSFLENMK